MFHHTDEIFSGLVLHTEIQVFERTADAPGHLWRDKWTTLNLACPGGTSSSASLGPTLTVSILKVDEFAPNPTETSLYTNALILNSTAQML